MGILMTLTIVLIAIGALSTISTLFIGLYPVVRQAIQKHPKQRTKSKSNEPTAVLKKRQAQLQQIRHMIESDPMLEEELRSVFLEKKRKAMLGSYFSTLAWTAFAITVGWLLGALLNPAIIFHGK